MGIINNDEVQSFKVCFENEEDKHIFFTVPITKEQKDFALNLVNFSIHNHTVSNIWDADILQRINSLAFLPKNCKKEISKNNAIEETIKNRFVGTLGEVIFADVYNFKRPIRSFGAIDGQDFGNDFKYEKNGKEYFVDLKTMFRTTSRFESNFVVNLSPMQLYKENSLTTHYYHISIEHSKEFRGKYINDDFLNSINFAHLIGSFKKEEVELRSEKFIAGEWRVNNNGHSFQFLQDTYEFPFKYIKSPKIDIETIKIKNIKQKYFIK